MAKTEDYQTLSAELDGVLAALQRPDLQVDEATTLYERGLKLISQLEAHVRNAQNKLTKIRLQTDASDTSSEES